MHDELATEKNLQLQEALGLFTSHCMSRMQMPMIYFGPNDNVRKLQRYELTMRTEVLARGCDGKRGEGFMKDDSKPSKTILHSRTLCIESGGVRIFNKIAM